MKIKNLSYWFISLLLLVSCKDEVNENSPIYPESFSGQQLVLHINEELVTDCTVAFEYKNNTEGVFVFRDLLPGETDLAVNAALKEEGQLTFAGENTNSGRKISIQGKIQKGILSVDVDFKITSPIIGSWEPSEIVGKDTLNTASLYVDISTSAVKEITMPQRYFNGKVDEDGKMIYDYPYILTIYETVSEYSKYQMGYINYLQNRVLSTILNPLSIEFNENGYLYLSFAYIDCRNNPADVERSIRYNIKDNQVFFSIPMRHEEKENLYLFLKTNEDRITLYMDKTVAEALTTYASSLKERVEGLPPTYRATLGGAISEESCIQYIDELVNLITTAERFDFGINLQPKILKE